MIAGFRGRVFVDNGPGLDCPDNQWLIPYLHRAVDGLVAKLPYLDPDYEYLSDELRKRWVHSRPYPERRRIQLINAIGPERRHVVVPFIKDEFYQEGDKPPRLICARDDVGKTIYGPLFQLLNDTVFHLPFATKHIPCGQRPAYIMDYLGSPGRHKYVVTDMSAFECAMRPTLQRHVEQRVYRKLIPSRYHCYLDQLIQKHVVTSRTLGVSATTEALRFSGDMNTSLGNTITNYCSIEATLAALGVTDFKCVVEGDDALIRMPASVDLNMYCKVMTSMGFNCKIEYEGMDPGRAGYCSMFWNSHLEVIVDPVKTLISFFVLPPHGDVESRLRMKALSLWHAAGPSPLLWALAKVFLTPGPAFAEFNLYEFEELQRDVGPVVITNAGMFVEIPSYHVYGPTPSQREYFHDMYGLSPATQIGLEADILRDPPTGVANTLRMLELVHAPSLAQMALHAVELGL